MAALNSKFVGYHAHEAVHFTVTAASELLSRAAGYTINVEGRLDDTGKGVQLSFPGLTREEVMELDRKLGEGTPEPPPGMVPSILTPDTLPSMEERLASAVREMLALFPGEDPNREGLRDTPHRVAKAFLNDFLSGYQQDPRDVLSTFDSDGYDEMVLVKDIPFFSTCEHHLVVFHGVAHVGYIPEGRIVGLSKLSRVVDIFARRLQVQERLTEQVADALETHLRPKGTMVVMSARHMCMEARGIRKAGSYTVTSAIRGVFRDENKGARQEFLRLIGQ
jgi:GTP cyclohydrolase I